MISLRGSSDNLLYASIVHYDVVMQSLCQITWHKGAPVKSMFYKRYLPNWQVRGAQAGQGHI